jgi:hypothetical protein
MATTVHHDQRNKGVAPVRTGQLRRVPLMVWVLACLGAMLQAGYQLFHVLEPPAYAIRSELEAAASEMRSQFALDPSPAVLAAMRQDFAGQDVWIATIPMSSVIAVTLQGLDRGVCVELEAKARRIEGPVVVMLQGYAVPEDCGSRNEITWWIMP